MRIRGAVGTILLIDVGLIAAALAIWFTAWSAYNRRKGDTTLRWIEAACAGHARIAEKRWTGFSQLNARVRFVALWLENARITIKLLPRPMPLRWALSGWRKQRETLTFEADLDYAPGLHLDLFRHRWVTHKQLNTSALGSNWAIYRPGPIALTTRQPWVQEFTPVVNTLMTSSGHNLLSVRFRPSSPHLAATVDLNALSSEQNVSAFLEVLRELAAGASTSKS